MINDYEQMLLDDRAELETKITNLLLEKLICNNETKEELDLIAEVIDYSYTITKTCSYEVDCPHLVGEITFSSIEDYQKRNTHYYNAEAAAYDGVKWSENYAFPGSFTWDGYPCVSVEVEGLTEDASEEAKTLWEQQSKAEKRHRQLKRTREQLGRKRQELEQTKKELLKLQADLAADEANA